MPPLAPRTATLKPRVCWATTLATFLFSWAIILGGGSFVMEAEQPENNTESLEARFLSPGTLCLMKCM
jgi:hypothetical protein